MKLRFIRKAHSPKRAAVLFVALLFSAVGIAQFPVSKASAAGGAIWPTSGSITSRYGDSRDNGARQHIGIDISTPGSVPILATQDGTVYLKEETPHLDSGYGYYVLLAHNNGYKSLYGHMTSSRPVGNGQFVRQGDVIGYMGDSGAGGHHLHFEIRNNASYGPNFDGSSINFNGAIPSSNSVGARDLINHPFPNLVPAVAETQVANVNGCGALYVKRTYWGNWDQHMGCGQAVRTALSPNGNTIAAIRPDGMMIAKDSYWGNWVQQYAPAKDVAVGDNGYIAVIDTCGAVKIKQSFHGGWNEHMGCGQAKSVSMSGNGNYVVVTRPDNTLVGKDSHWGNWITHTAVGDSHDSAVNNHGHIASVNGCGAVYVKRGYWANWEQHMGCGQAKEVGLSPNGEGIVVVRPDNTLIAKQSYWGDWHQHVGVGDTQHGAIANP